MNKKGFTLIELLVVIAIIGVLVGISIPYYLKYKESAYKIQVKSDVRNLIESIILFETTYKTTPNLYPNPCSEDLTTCALTDGTNQDTIRKTKGVELKMEEITCQNNTKGFKITGQNKTLNYNFSFNSCTDPMIGTENQ
ncbi:hypothetical protein JCM14244_01820 [Venenivibrio stagnispumantis]|uniref:Prepilin-type N-terminal cleavage/methylation domain-containing protein n=1 Tax=Venenivibrio stagnispumantis TaxID=407998 RepID=A0AA46AE24_9AQUI|nr:prepilin-type N-terminal cleavage/methylation domain-containing protein [Venenivibrio stagnispumantis]MCW4573338.1 prepilin-type N-terminal cleavage/methylation domain-containing protein [Venenivibrio stagnispumantis]SMP10667.1 prepilin-type N-terminal cleavage/methylation domain-containing protein [Venenivibrio stagnispumantis]